jgi:hypothetical protein
MMSPLALQPGFRPKPQSTPTRLLAREAAELRQTEFSPWGQFLLAGLGDLVTQTHTGKLITLPAVEQATV